MGLKSALFILQNENSEHLHLCWIKVLFDFMVDPFIRVFLICFGAGKRTRFQSCNDRIHSVKEKWVYDWWTLQSLVPIYLPENTMVEKKNHYFSRAFYKCTYGRLYVKKVQHLSSWEVSREGLNITNLEPSPPGFI